MPPAEAGVHIVRVRQVQERVAVFEFDADLAAEPPPGRLAGLEIALAGWQPPVSGSVQTLRSVQCIYDGPLQAGWPWRCTEPTVSGLLFTGPPHLAAGQQGLLEGV